MGYLLQSVCRNAEEAMISVKIVYAGGVFLQLFMMLSIFNFCRIEISRLTRVLLFTVGTFIYASILSIGYTDLSAGCIRYFRFMLSFYSWPA